MGGVVCGRNVVRAVFQIGESVAREKSPWIAGIYRLKLTKTPHIAM